MGSKLCIPQDTQPTEELQPKPKSIQPIAEKENAIVEALPAYFFQKSSQKLMDSINCIRSVKNQTNLKIIAGTLKDKADQICVLERNKLLPVYGHYCAILDLFPSWQPDCLEIWFIDGLGNVKYLYLGHDYTYKCIQEVNTYEMSKCRRFFGKEFNHFFFSEPFLRDPLYARTTQVVSRSRSYNYARKCLRIPIWQKQARSGNKMLYRHGRVFIQSPGGELTVAKGVNGKRLCKVKTFTEGEMIVEEMETDLHGEIIASVGLLLGTEGRRRKPHVVVFDIRRRKAIGTGNCGLGETDDDLLATRYAIAGIVELGRTNLPAKNRESNILLLLSFRFKLATIILNCKKEVLTNISMDIIHTKTEITGLSIRYPSFTTTGRDGYIREWELDTQTIGEQLKVINLL